MSSLSDGRDLCVGFIGLGRMGWPIAERLSSGCEKLIVCSRTRPAVDEFARRFHTAVGESPADVARSADVVFAMVTNAEVTRTVLAGPGGVASAISPGKIVVNLGTSSPAEATRYARCFQSVGAAFLDAPVSGTVDAARAGELAIMVGGDKTTFTKIRPLLEQFSSSVALMGGTGAGAATKLALNVALYALAMGVAESLALARSLGLDARLFYTVLEHSAVAGPMIAHRREGFLDPDTAPVRFPLRAVEEDLALILSAGQATGIELAQVACNVATIRRAIEQGHGADDLAVVTKVVPSLGSDCRVPAVGSAIAEKLEAERSCPSDAPISTGRAMKRTDRARHGP